MYTSYTYSRLTIRFRPGALPLGHWNVTAATSWAVAPDNIARDATTPAECVVAVEGCTDPSATNYDPAATTDLGGWCVSRVAGCMAPRGASNFRPDATVSAGCIGIALGCTLLAAVNYNSVRPGTR